MAPAFLSRRVADTYLRYSAAQFAKAQRGVAQTGKPVWRHVTHLLRLLTAGAGLVETGVLTLDVGEQRDDLLAIKSGRVPWGEVVARQEQLSARIAVALPSSPLPELPDTAAVEAWLISVRRRSLSE